MDYEFYKLAKENNIEILEGVKIKSHNVKKLELCLSNNQTFQYQNLVFADGTLRYGSKYQDKKKQNIALQLTFPNNHLDEIQIHFGITKKGYGWVSSYQGVTNVGLTDVYYHDCNYREVFSQFLKKLNIDANMDNLKGAFTPIGVRKPIINNTLFYVGDAVGACDPLTLSGLRYGLITGEKCALAIANKNMRIYKNYIRKLKFKFFFMKMLQKIFYIKSVLFVIPNIGCRYFRNCISFIFNNFLINKK